MMVRPFMGLYIRRWAGLGGLLWLAGQAASGLGLAALGGTALAGAWGALVMAVLLALLRHEMQP